MSLSSATRLGPYEILSRLGAGGMGEVYRARDTRLDRDVAIKVLPESLARDPDALARFEREAKAVAALSHPNILSIFDFGTYGDIAFAVTELLEGVTLRDRLDGGPLPLKQAVAFALQTAKGLSAAHEKGIVHRDLKPENLFVTRDGHLKILDFGLAKKTEQDKSEEITHAQARTEAGAVMGTIGYMAPEQVRGAAVDHRSDIFSLGAILYEMLTGGRAFRRDSAAETMVAILSEEPPDLWESTRNVSPALSGIVHHCLEKNADERFQSARDLIFNLQQVSGGTSATGVEGVFPVSIGRAPSVAVLPFLNFSADPENEFFADGMTEDVIANLSKIRSVKVISRTSVMAFKKREQSLREIGKKLGAATILDGSIRRAGNRVRIVAQLLDAWTDEHLWSETYDRELTDIFAIQTDVALQIAGALRAELSPDERTRIQKKPTSNAGAYQLYLQGRHAYNRATEDGFRQAIDYFETAISQDPNLAVAYVGLALLYGELMGRGSGELSPAEALKKAKEAVEKALAIDDALGDAHSVVATLMFMGDHDWVGAEKELKLALELAPGSAITYFLYSLMCSALGRYDDALRLVTRAQELDPLRHKADLATELLRSGRYAEALDVARRVVDFDPGLTRGYSVLGWAHILMGNHGEGIAALERAVSLAPGATLFEAQLGEAYALAGRGEDARAILRSLHALAEQRYVSPYHFAYVHAGLGEQDEAIDWLEKAYEQRTGGIYGIRGSFLFTGLREHTRFKALLKRMNLPAD